MKQSYRTAESIVAEFTKSKVTHDELLKALDIIADEIGKDSTTYKILKKQEQEAKKSFEEIRYARYEPMTEGKQSNGSIFI